MRSGGFQKRPIPFGIKVISILDFIGAVLMLYTALQSVMIAINIIDSAIGSEKFIALFVLVPGIGFFSVSVFLLLTGIALLKGKSWGKITQLISLVIPAIYLGRGILFLSLLNRRVSSSLIYMLIWIVVAIMILVYLFRSKKAKEFFAK